MEFSLDSLLRENIKNIKPYSTARDEYTGVALINLDANENPYGSIGKDAHNRYPDPYQTPLKELISSIKQVPANQIFLGNGSDEGIDLIYTAFCEPGIDNSIICPPTYGMYEVSADTNNIKCLSVPLTNDYQLQVEKILDTINANTKLIWICSPNNPTGNLIVEKDIETILKSFNGIVVIDEAYIDFAPQTSWSAKLKEYPNLIVLQTFSKAWGLANIRLGMMFASQEIIAIINKIKLPYNISGLVQDYAYETIKNHKSEKDDMVKGILSERVKLSSELKKIKEVEAIYPSDSNFLLVKMKDAHNAYSYLVDKGIIVRDRSKVLLCEDSLRITIGTSQENQELIEKLLSFYKN